MNGAQLQAWMTAHKWPLLAGGGGVAVVAALRARTKKQQGAGNSSTVGQPTTVAIPAGYAPGPGPLDSSANDYDQALAPNLSQLAQQVQALNGNIEQMRNTIPVSPPTAAAGGTAPTPSPSTGSLATQEAIQKVAGNTIVTPGSAPTSAQTFSHLSSFQGLPAGTALFTRNPDGSYNWLSPAEAAAQKPGTAFYVQGNNNKAPA